MMSFISPTSAAARQRRPALALLAVSCGVAFAVIFGGSIGGLRINTTPSEPLGLWRVAALDRPVQVGDLVFVCPPMTDAISEGFARGYLRSGLCPGGFGPLIKTVAAVGGQHIEISSHVTVDGRPIASSSLVSQDGQGRPLRPYVGGTIPAGFVFLHSPFPGSWDSRYFGPVPVSGVLGLARQVLTYAP
ncbi:conjugation peptidase TraF. Serine peptidase. MEROPS family S26C [Rhizobium tibeticum]|uniref:Conjugal transfer pilin processing protease TraF n=1 Tax=Rhizobium tibeticum TaxID=501024 RepID=A0A1H8WUR7_9HYPH|nr:conjugative transfer signal peptidase TraF [Rhizobium tibeticum]SEI19247.1 conjugal transfer pilin processing protease TraF [Rhizobium tibeticum]SEP31233.1 conjugation peptidase TraF. Serine peptidase. MEROPS family S26C [Rhizobium tibeticum]